MDYHWLSRCHRANDLGENPWGPGLLLAYFNWLHDKPAAANHPDGDALSFCSQAFRRYLDDGFH
jgi:hypothetical protein